MKELYERFGLTTDLKVETSKFRTKLDNLFSSSQFGSEVLDNKEDNIIWRFANLLGEKYTHLTYTDEKRRFILPARLSFNEFLFRLQVVINLLWESREDVATQLGRILDRYLGESALSLGYFVKIYKTKPPQILPASNKRQAQKILQAFDQLESKPKKYESVIEHFESGMKELLTAESKAQLKDTVEDMATVCDSLVKTVFNDQNIGFKHLFKDERWKKIGLNETQKKIFSDLNNTFDQIKHDVIRTYSREDIEIFVYLTSSLIEKIAK